MVGLLGNIGAVHVQEAQALCNKLLLLWDFPALPMACADGCATVGTGELVLSGNGWCAPLTQAAVLGWLVGIPYAGCSLEGGQGSATL